MLGLFGNFGLDSRLFSEVNLRSRILNFLLLLQISERKDVQFLPAVVMEKIKSYYIPFITVRDSPSYQMMTPIAQRWYTHCFKNKIDRQYKELSINIFSKISDMGLYEYIDMLKHKDKFMLEFSKLNDREAEFRGGGPPMWRKDLVNLLLEGSFIDFRNTTAIVKMFSEILDLKDKMDKYHKDVYITLFRKYSIFFQILYDRLFYIIDTSIKDYKIVRIEDKLRLCITCYVSPDYEMIREGKKQRNVGLRRFTGYYIERIEKMSIKPEVMFYSTTILEHNREMYFKIFDSEKLEGYNYQGAYVPANCVEY